MACEPLLFVVEDDSAFAHTPEGDSFALGFDDGTVRVGRVAFHAELLPDQEALVYTAGSALRSDVSGPGYWVFTPARLADGSLIVVNRGFVPEGRQDPNSRAGGQGRGLTDIVGAMRWPEPRGPFTPADDPQRNLWFVRDHIAADHHYFLPARI